MSEAPKYSVKRRLLREMEIFNQKSSNHVSLNVWVRLQPGAARHLLQHKTKTSSQVQVQANKREMEKGPA